MKNVSWPSKKIGHTLALLTCMLVHLVTFTGFLTFLIFF